jgi:hypothetical protein
VPHCSLHSNCCVHNLNKAFLFSTFK